MAMTTVRPPDAPLSLALAVITASAAPMLLIDDDMTLLGASASFYAAFELDPVLTIGRQVYELDGGRWDTPRFRSVLAAARSTKLPVDAYELALQTRHRGIRQLVLQARKLDYSESDNVRVLLSITDVTDTRLAEKLKDDLVRDKAVLLQEVQHRVANSLQIIASVLMQSARKVQTDEARVYLSDAHHRVMTVAAVQKQLAITNSERVELKPYLTQLCQSIGASMIADHDRIVLTATIDASTVAPNTSTSIGLIVTELVINALKHAFPDDRRGKITVEYTANGSGWTLVVSDNGIGMPVEPHLADSGLGTSIVHALAKQLRARITVGDANPGTTVSVVHTRLAAVNDGDSGVPAEIAV